MIRGPGITHGRPTYAGTPRSTFVDTRTFADKPTCQWARRDSNLQTIAATSRTNVYVSFSNLIMSMATNGAICHYFDMYGVGASCFM